MEVSGNKKLGKTKLSEVKTFPIPFALGANKGTINIYSNNGGLGNPFGTILPAPPLLPSQVKRSFSVL